jgi:hypothetical protein
VVQVDLELEQALLLPQELLIQLQLVLVGAGGTELQKANFWVLIPFLALLHLQVAAVVG